MLYFSEGQHNYCDLFFDYVIPLICYLVVVIDSYIVFV